MAVATACGSPAASSIPASPAEAPSPPPSLVAAAPAPAASTVPAGPTPVVVATDLGASDIMAIALLLGRSDVRLSAILVTGTGGVHCPIGARNANDLLNELGAGSVPVACGRKQPLSGSIEFSSGHRALADEMYDLGIVGIPPGATIGSVDVLREAVAAEGTVTVLSLGPLTDLGEALDADPSLTSGIDRMVVLGGTLEVPGNSGPTSEGAAEWNMGIDPRAADIVLGAGVPITMIPLDATEDVPIEAAFVEQLAAGSPAGGENLVHELLTYRIISSVVGSAFFWDPLAALALVDPDVVTTEETTIRVVQDGPDAGSTIRDPAGHPVTVATAADRARFEAGFLAAIRATGPRLTPFEPPETVGSITVTYDGTTCVAGAPESPARGAYDVVFHNENQVFSGGGIARLALGRTLDELRGWIETHFEPGDPPPSDLAVFLGGVDANPGNEARLILELDQGTFVAVCSPWEGPGEGEVTLDVTTFAVP